MVGDLKGLGCHVSWSLGRGRMRGLRVAKSGDGTEAVDDVFWGWPGEVFGEGFGSDLDVFVGEGGDDIAEFLGEAISIEDESMEELCRSQWEQQP